MTQPSIGSRSIRIEPTTPKCSIGQRCAAPQQDMRDHKGSLFATIGHAKTVQSGQISHVAGENVALNQSLTDAHVGLLRAWDIE